MTSTSRLARALGGDHASRDVFTELLREDVFSERPQGRSRTPVKFVPGPRPYPTPGAPSLHSSHTPPGRGQHHPAIATSPDRQSHHAAPDCSRAHRGDLRTGCIRRLRSGGADPSSRLRGDRTRGGEHVARAADLGPRARDRGCPTIAWLEEEARQLGYVFPGEKLYVIVPPGGAKASTGGVSVPLPTFKVPTPIPSPTPKPTTSPSPNPGSSPTPSPTATHSPTPTPVPPRQRTNRDLLCRGDDAACGSSLGGVEQWKLVGLITRRSSVRIRPPQFHSLSVG